MLKVEVVYVAKDKNIFFQQLVVQDGATIAEVLKRSSLFLEHPEAQKCSVGIFSKKRSHEQLVKQGDRIEVYRELLIDPMEKRRQKAKKD